MGEILTALDLLSIAGADEIAAACARADGMDTRRDHIAGGLATLAAYAAATEREQARADADEAAARERERLAAIQAERS